MYIYNLVGWLTQPDVDRLIQEISGTTTRYQDRIPIGLQDVIDIDLVEKLWNVHRGVIFEYIYKELWYSHYLLLPNKLPDNKLKYTLVKDFDYGTTEPQLWLYMSILQRRMKQRIETRKHIDGLIQTAKDSSSYYETLLSSLTLGYERLPNGEDIFWFDGKERGLFQKMITKTLAETEEYYRPGNKGYEEAEQHYKALL
jgi:hypothetical protein